MLSVRALYDGQKLVFQEPLKMTTPQEVIVVFLDTKPKKDKKIKKTDNIEVLEMMSMVAASASFDFLNDEEEDIYSDAHLKKIY